jgi:hypothetical protein
MAPILLVDRLSLFKPLSFLRDSSAAWGWRWPFSPIRQHAISHIKYPNNIARSRSEAKRLQKNLRGPHPTLSAFPSWPGRRDMSP